MLDAVSAWIKTIILLVLFASFLELLLPSSGMQRFIRVIIGLLITLAILNPVLHVLENNWTDQQVPALSRSSSGAQSMSNHVGKMAGEREQLAVETYKKELARQIKATVNALEGVADVQVAVSLDDTARNQPSGKIDRITLYVRPGQAGSNKIEKVSVNSSASGKSKDFPEQLKSKIRKTVGELYQLAQSQIEIKQLH